MRVSRITAAARIHSMQPVRPMLHAAALAGLLIGASTTHATDYPTLVLGTSGLVGYWQFGIDMQADSSANGYTGAFIGDAAVSAAGLAPTFIGVDDNRAVLLDGDRDGVLTNLAAQVRFEKAATIVAWVYLDVQPSTAGRVLYIAGRSQVGNDLDLQIDGDNLMRFYTTSGGGAAAPAPLPLQQWVMVAGSFDTVANTRTVYVDGKPVGSDAPGSHGADNAPFSIGYSTVFPGRWFQGRIDDVAIFDRALTAQEILALEQAAGDLIFRSGFSY